MGSSQNGGPILVPLNLWCRNIIYNPKEPIILGTTYVGSGIANWSLISIQGSWLSRVSTFQASDNLLLNAIPPQVFSSSFIGHRLPYEKWRVLNRSASRTAKPEGDLGSSLQHAKTIKYFGA